MKRPLPLAPIIMAFMMSTAPGGAEEPASTWAPAAAPQERSELETLLTRLDDDERALNAELGRIGPELDITRRRMLARARAYYRMLRAGYLPAGGGFDALVDYAASVERTRRALERDRATEAELLRRRAAIGDKLARMRVMRAPLEVQREAMIRARMALQQADERRAAFARAFESSVRPPDYMTVYGAEFGPSDVDPRAGFRALKGRLPLPVSGRAEVRRVMRRGAGGPGLELDAIPGATARSVAAGRVVFADRYDDYGLTVILDHGDHSFSLYATLGSIDVRVGDNVPQGSRIGVVGSVDGRPAMLYFELRQSAETVDPTPWLGL